MELLGVGAKLTFVVRSEHAGSKNPYGWPLDGIALSSCIQRLVVLDVMFLLPELSFISPALRRLSNAANDLVRLCASVKQSRPLDFSTSNHKVRGPRNLATLAPAWQSRTFISVRATSLGQSACGIPCESILRS